MRIEQNVYECFSLGEFVGVTGEFVGGAQNTREHTHECV